ncbi:hypothetical protein [Roseivirga thermotolerans]|uniref:Uncharacterized protein n=1 Tax=Roseivirga thermotolerans TaxID=1758176 RepID=A0ABQ3I4L5_9BACT|nr:hypothetical protein [Roseivirga thermotolerans]GHE53763.1 hypothetical protein GCM10011340_05340 [Roseivirga thermotolerans]
MLYQLKQSEVLTVSQKIGESICDKTFQNYTKIDGEQLISLTNSRQVNSFIIRSLFNQWRKEVERLESPYFDFKHEKVQAALKDFMNVLSNHISIDRKHLEPILNQAIADTVLIVFEPRVFLETVLERLAKPQDFKRQFKYIKNNRELFKKLVDQMGDFDTKASVLQIYDGLNQSNKEEVNAPAFLEKLNAGHLLHNLFDEKEEPKPEKPTEPEVPANVASKVVAEELAVEKKEEKAATTLNDRFEKGNKSQTLAEKLQRKVNKSIEASLTLNEKFMFQNNLFHGDNSRMKQAFAAIDEAESLQEALNIANTFNDGWDMDSEEVEAFMGVLERRFA